MNVINMIKLLAEVCNHGANRKIYLRVKNKNIPLGHCIDDFIDHNSKEKERILVLVPEGDEYYGV